MSRPRVALAVGFVVLGSACRGPAPPRPAARDVNVGAVKGTSLVVAPAKPVCGPDASSALLETEEAIGRPIRALCVRGVDDDLRERAQAVIRSKVGEKLNATGLQLDTSYLFESGFFRHVDVLARTEGDGIELTFELEPRPIIRSVEVLGPAPPDHELQKLVGTFYSPSNLRARADELGEDYEVEHAVTPQPDGVRVRVVVTKRGARK